MPTPPHPNAISRRSCAQPLLSLCVRDLRTCCTFVLTSPSALRDDSPVLAALFVPACACGAGASFSLLTVVAFVRARPPALHMRGSPMRPRQHRRADPAPPGDRRTYPAIEMSHGRRRIGGNPRGKTPFERGEDEEERGTGPVRRRGGPGSLAAAGSGAGRGGAGRQTTANREKNFFLDFFDVKLFPFLETVL